MNQAVISSEWDHEAFRQGAWGVNYGPACKRGVWRGVLCGLHCTYGLRNLLGYILL